MPIRLNRDGVHCGIGIGGKRGIDHTQRADACETIAHGCADECEVAAKHQPAICLFRDAAHDAVRIRIESEIERAVGIESGNAVACLPTHLSKITADEDAAIPLQGHAANDAIHIAGEWGRGAVSSQFHEVVGPRIKEVGETASDEDTTIFEGDDRVHSAARVNAHVKAVVG